jgi:hypothetical protein
MDHLRQPTLNRARAAATPMCTPSPPHHRPACHPPPKPARPAAPGVRGAQPVVEESPDGPLESGGAAFPFAADLSVDVVTLAWPRVK